MAVEIFNRQELKFLITAQQQLAIISAMAPHMQLDIHNKHGMPYRLYNLYIDTEDNALIRHSLSKPVYKEKLRIRSYHDFGNDSLVFLEVKKRFKRITNKRRTKIGYEDALRFIRTGNIDIKGYMNPQVISEMKVMLRNTSYHPKTFITYDRMAYVASNEAVDLRITFDSTITTRRFNQNIEQQILDHDQIIMEVKSIHNMPMWLVDVLTEMGIHKQGFSKYGREYMRYLQTTAAKNVEAHYA